MFIRFQRVARTKFTTSGQRMKNATGGAATAQFPCSCSPTTCGCDHDRAASRAGAQEVRLRPDRRGLKPLCAGEELELRTSLLLMRDRAMATKPNACEPSWHLLDVVENVTRETALNPRMDLEQLRELRRLCVMCVCNAASFDTLFQPRLPLGEGEAK
jgi:hypothetical protein